MLIIVFSILLSLIEHSLFYLKFVIINILYNKKCFLFHKKDLLLNNLLS